ncbi:MAG: SagB/ThcOx family dehydrogenase [Thermoplasmata archaeon]
MDRESLKDYVREKVDFSRTDQKKGVPMPPVQKEVPEQAELIYLPDPKDLNIDVSLTDAISNRESKRSFKEEPIDLEELSFLLWATQGVRENNNSQRTYRTVPSAGCRHTFETYIAGFDVNGLDEAIYRYLPLEHKLVKEKEPEDMGDKVAKAARGQTFVGNCAATFIWTTMPYRMEWRYGEASYKVIAIDVGHVCQNLYLACEAIDAGTCAIAAYDQDLMDSLLQVDGKDEFTIYLAPVGKLP